MDPFVLYIIIAFIVWIVAAAIHVYYTNPIDFDEYLLIMVVNLITGAVWPVSIVILMMGGLIFYPLFKFINYIKHYKPKKTELS